MGRYGEEAYTSFTLEKRRCVSRREIGGAIGRNREI